METYFFNRYLISWYCPTYNFRYSYQSISTDTNKYVCGINALWLLCLVMSTVTSLVKHKCHSLLCVNTVWWHHEVPSRQVWQSIAIFYEVIPWHSENLFFGMTGIRKIKVNRSYQILNNSMCIWFSFCSRSERQRVNSWKWPWNKKIFKVVKLFEALPVFGQFLDNLPTLILNLIVRKSLVLLNSSSVVEGSGKTHPYLVSLAILLFPLLKLPKIISLIFESKYIWKRIHNEGGLNKHFNFILVIYSVITKSVFQFV